MQYDRVAGVPTEAVPLASTFFDITGKPQITPRMTEKSHGMRNLVDGIYNEGDVVLLLEGTTTRGKSMVDAKKVLESVGLVVHDAIVVCDRQQGATELLAQYGATLHPVLELKKVLPFFAQQGFISQDQLHAILQELYVTKRT